MENQNENINYYELLGVSVKSSSEEITAAKNALAKKFHPDANMKNGIDTTAQMQKILEAYRVLSDPARRAEYDRELAGRRCILQTFDLHEMEQEEESDAGFILYWKAAGSLYDIITESDDLYRQKHQTTRLGQLAIQALKYILILREAQIPERYWHPDIMNWLLFKWYTNRNYTIPYLLDLYDEYLHRDFGKLAQIRLHNKAVLYQRSVKKLMRY